MRRQSAGLLVNGKGVFARGEDRKSQEVARKGALHRAETGRRVGLLILDWERSATTLCWEETQARVPVEGGEAK